MNTPNNAAALERLEATESQMREWITAEVEPDLDRANQRIHEQTVALDKARAGVREATAHLSAAA